MTTLLLIELRRLAARRFLHLIVLAALVGGAIGGLVVYLRSSPTQYYTIDHLKNTLQGTTVPFVLASWLLGSSFVGAEWRAGTMTTLLTWEPRRFRVLLAKVLAVASTSAMMLFVLQVAIGAMLLPGAYRRPSGVQSQVGGFHGSARIDAAWLHSVGGFLGRGAALAAIAAVIGFAIGAIGRNTAFGLGVGFVYLAILEGGLIGHLFPSTRRWLLVGNSIVFVSGRSDPEVAGRSTIGAGLVLGAYAIGAFLVAVAIFRARDVT